VRTRRDFLSIAGKSLGLAALSSATVASLLRNVEAASKNVAHLTPEEAAMDEDYWATIQNSFSVTRGIINLNNGGVSPSPRIVTEALVRYIWEQEDATAYTMWQILELQSETIRTGLAELFGCAIRRSRSRFCSWAWTSNLATKFSPPPRTTRACSPPCVSGKNGNTSSSSSFRFRFRRRTLTRSPPRLKKESPTVLASSSSPTRSTSLPLKQSATSRAPAALRRSSTAPIPLPNSISSRKTDYFGTSLHKWLYAPKGTGMLYVKRDKIDKLWPLMAAEAKQAWDIRKFEEIGTHSAAPKLAIGEALLFHNGIGGKRKEARLRYLSRYWMNRLKDVPKIRFNTSFDPNQSCAIGNVHIDGTNPEAVTKYLFDK